MRRVLPILALLVFGLCGVAYADIDSDIEKKTLQLQSLQWEANYINLRLQNIKAEANQLQKEINSLDEQKKMMPAVEDVKEEKK